MKINSKYQNPIKYCIHGLSVIGVILSLISLPVQISFPLTFLFALLSFLAEKIIFRIKAIWVLPIFRLDEFVAFAWFKKQYKGQETLGIGIVFNGKESAVEAYRTIRTWNLNTYIDRDANINLSIIEEEGDKRFSFFLYPGDRYSIEKQIKRDVLIGKSNHDVELSRIFPWLLVCSEYSNREYLYYDILSLKEKQLLLLDTQYLEDDITHSPFKRLFVLNKINFLKRSDLSEANLEYYHEWSQSEGMYKRNRSLTATLDEKIRSEQDTAVDA